ncbi:hypothetical protein AQUCO_04700019v1 [Aquilegia coerulea]|uniref:Myb/SANT-like domain-containing protein n=1 Tax=Aquilegia coerulea TaxID=218851 RepID=A0A2G5CM05_AQUCA|nr:hypothetical protein AQUCO_04700019v1 [Aquilegia coerulea]
MDWTDNNENAFLSMLHEKVKRDPKGAPTFKTSDWNAMDNELYLSIGKRYGAERLKGKYNRLRSKHRDFSDLLEHTGVTYDLGSNTVFAPEDVWQMFFKVVNIKIFDIIMFYISMWILLSKMKFLNIRLLLFYRKLEHN